MARKKIADAKTQAQRRGLQAEKTRKLLRIKLVRSVIGCSKYQREVVKGLGLRKLNSEVIREDCPEIRGMINKIPHLLKIEYMEKK